MPRGIPTINSSLREELSQPAPAPEVLGSVKTQWLDEQPLQPTTIFTRESGETMTLTEPPPPWEVSGDKRYAASDARQFVDVPENWELRWINPKTLDQFGWRYWQPVMASDSRVKVKVSTMISVENNIRRGGQTGDILAWMYRSWVVARRRELAQASAQLKQSSVDKTTRLHEEARRGTFGPNVSITDATHPTHTIGEGRSMKD